MVTAPPPLAFPVNGGVAFPVSPALAAQAIGLRIATPSDIPFLRDIYASTRERELAQTGWPHAARQAFVDSQFALQHQHYIHYYPRADFLVVEQSGRRVGRYYVDRGHSRSAVEDSGPDPAPQSDDFLLVDITLARELRGLGIGGALIRNSQQQAASLGVGMQLHVHHDNADARRLYQRLGFTIVGDETMHQRMRWAP